MKASTLRDFLDSEYNRFLLSDGRTAHGTETRKQPTSRAPFSRLERSKVTGPARYYRDMLLNIKGGDVLLVAHLGKEIGRDMRAKHSEMQLSCIYQWAIVLLNKHLGNTYSHSEVARMIGCKHHNDYIRNYLSHESLYLSWLKSWEHQAQGDDPKSAVTKKG